VRLRGNFTQVPNSVLRCARLSASARLTFALLLSYAWRSASSTRVSQRTLSRDLGLSVRQVRRYLEELEVAGLVERVRQRTETGKRNLYELHLADWDEDMVVRKAGDVPVPLGGEGDDPTEKYSVTPSFRSPMAEEEDIHKEYDLNNGRKVDWPSPEALRRMLVELCRRKGLDTRVVEPAVEATLNARARKPFAYATTVAEVQHKAFLQEDVEDRDRRRRELKHKAWEDQIARCPDCNEAGYVELWFEGEDSPRLDRCLHPSLNRSGR
jgi:DNA-binding Lrp family transcriptional regulator